MAQCSNCKKSLSCGCQKRAASNGVSVCTNCIGTYEAALAIAKQNSKQPPQTGTNK